MRQQEDLSCKKKIWLLLKNRRMGKGLSLYRNNTPKQIQMSMVKIPSLKLFTKRVPFPSAGGQKGSMSVEGSMVLPLFLFFIMTTLLTIETVRFQSQVQAALHQAGNYAAFTRKTEGDCTLQIKEYLREQTAPFLPVRGGEEGLLLKTDSALGTSGQIWITADYEIKPFLISLPIGTVHFRDEFYGHAWVGYEGNEGGIGQEESYVYVTETGSRYHLSADCTYLRIPVRAVTDQQLLGERNEHGGKYRACERCRPGKKGVFYIAEQGNRYHGASDCSALKRTVHLIPLSQAGNYTPCSKCAG